MRTSGLVGPVLPIQRALLVIAHGTDGIVDVVEDVVLPDPAIRVLEAAEQVIHAIRRTQRQPAAVRLEQAAARGRRGILVGHGDAAAGNRVLGRGFPRLEIIPRVIADIVRAAGLVDAQEMDGAVAVAELDADVGAVHAHGPVGHAVRVDFAAEDPDGGGVAGVRRDGDVDGGVCGGEAKERCGGDAEGHHQPPTRG